MKTHLKTFTLIGLIVLLFIPAFPVYASTTTPPTSYTFTSFNTGTITAGASAVSYSMNVSSLPSTEYLFFKVTADYIPSASPNNAWSSYMNLAITNGGATIYWPESTAKYGVLPGDGNTTLEWLGMLPKSYTGGTPLYLAFRDSYDGGGGPWTSVLHNVSFSIYPAPVSSYTFTSFNTGTISSSGTIFTKSLDTSNLHNAEYLFINVTADYVSGSAPHDAWSQSMNMEVNDGSSLIYMPATTATFGALGNANSTTLQWVGQLKNPYPFGSNLAIKFSDSDNRGSNPPYNSQLNNVIVKIYPSPTPKHSFATFNSGTLTAGNPAAAFPMTVSSLPSAEYLFFKVTADYVPSASPNNAWSSYMNMAITNGGATVYWPESTAKFGVLPGDGSTTLVWMGMLPKSYTGGTPLSLTFRDSYDGGGGPWTSTLSNVSFSIYPAVTSAQMYTASSCSGVTAPCTTSLAQAISDVAPGGTVYIKNTLANESVTINKDVTLDAGSPGVITGNGGAAAIAVTSGTALIQNLTINAGTSTNAITVSSGDLTVRGDNINGNGAAAINRTAGTVTAYANNITNTGGAGVSGTVSASENWWGTASTKPSGVSSADWSARLGAAISSVAFGDGSPATLGNAQLTGPGPGTGVIMSFGRGAANAPFGVGTSPAVDQACSPFYDFYSTGGSGWSVVLPIDVGTSGCTTNVLTPKKAYMIADSSQCSTATSGACWDLIPAGQITVSGNNLVISGLSLSGTHIVAGDSTAGNDPTIVRLLDFSAKGKDQTFILVVISVLMISTGGLFWARFRKCKMQTR